MECENRNSFCYVCGLFAPAKHRRNISKQIVEAFEGYFVMAYRPNLWYVPEVICDYCHRSLLGWSAKTHRPKYVQPIVWLPRSEHSEQQCYFCVNRVDPLKGIRYNTRDKMEIRYVESVIPPQLRSPEHPYAPSECEEENETTYFPMEFDDIGEGPSTSSSIRVSTSVLRKTELRPTDRPPNSDRPTFLMVRLGVGGFQCLGWVLGAPKKTISNTIS